MWRIPAFILIIIFLIPFTTHANSASVYVAKDSRVYHYNRNCSNITTTDGLMEFSSSQDAKDAGAFQCEHCNQSAVVEENTLGGNIGKIASTEQGVVFTLKSCLYYWGGVKGEVPQGIDLTSYTIIKQIAEEAILFAQERCTRRNPRSGIWVCLYQTGTLTGKYKDNWVVRLVNGTAAKLPEYEWEEYNNRALDEIQERSKAEKKRKVASTKKQDKSKVTSFGGKYYREFSLHEGHEYMEFFADRGNVFIDADDRTLLADYFISGDNVIISLPVGFSARGKITKNTIVFPVISSRDFPPLALIFRGKWMKLDDLQY